MSNATRALTTIDLISKSRARRTQTALVCTDRIVFVRSFVTDDDDDDGRKNVNRKEYAKLNLAAENPCDGDSRDAGGVDADEN